MTRRARAAVAGCAAALLVVIAAAWWVVARRTPEPPPRLSVAAVLGAPSDDAGFERALRARPFRFPEDHGPHPQFRDEWWYWTGNLAGPGGRHIGYELTIFRSALAPGTPDRRASAWRARQIYMAHLAVTDVEGERFYAFEQTSRSALGLAGATVAPFHVWVEDWSAASDSGELTPFHLRAARPDAGIDLVLGPGKPIVLQGDRGLSQKGQLPGNASYYYSIPRLPTSGTVTLKGQRFEVTGESWMDREWSTSALEPGDVGWDWFALQLDDQRELMFFRLRQKDGSASPQSAGTLVDAAGAVRRLTRGEVDIETLSKWKSPHSGAEYPSSFRLRVPGAGLDCEIAPLLRDQELNLTFRYWEGAVRATCAGVQRAEGSTPPGEASGGRGYVELTGYGEPREP
jgi:predicted secreted hydrolase